ncbi:unnamed protein product [Heterobilharzia americana]|nr:unnamed protein product [Heterobilharzia americana]
MPYMHCRHMVALITAYYILSFTATAALLLSEENVKYNLQIKGTAVLDEISNDVIKVFSKSGQKFSCYWTDGNFSTSESVASYLSNSAIYSLFSMLNESDCLSVRKGWWTYEFCFRKHIIQYHDGSRKTSETLLGVYDHDYNWDNSSQIEDKPKYHSQFYINGSTCDLTGNHRKAEVQFVCTDTPQFYIVSVDEPETCVYLLKISTPNLCTNMHFTLDASVKSHGIMCHPALNESDYHTYQALKSKNPNPQLSSIESSKNVKISTKRVFTYRNVYDKIRDNRRRHQLNSFRRSVGQFLKGLKAFSTLYKKQKLRTMDFYPVFLLDSNSVNTYALWSHITQFIGSFLNFTPFLLKGSTAAYSVPLDVVKISIIVTKSVISEMEDYYQLLEKSLLPEQAMGLISALNLTDIYESVGQMWNTLSNYSDPTMAHKSLSILIHAFKKHKVDIPTIEDVPLPSIRVKSSNSIEYYYRKYKLHFESSIYGYNNDDNRIVQHHNRKPAYNLLSYEEYSNIFPIMEKVKKYTNLFLTVLKLEAKKLVLLHNAMEASHTIEEQLEQTLASVLTNSKVKVIMVRGSDSVLNGKSNRAGQWKDGLSKSLGQQEIMEIIQKVVTNLSPKTSDDFDVFETSENQAGLSTYLIMPSGPKRRRKDVYENWRKTINLLSHQIKKIIKFDNADDVEYNCLLVNHFIHSIFLIIFCFILLLRNIILLLLFLCG